MKRSTFITWDQLKVGLLIVLAIVVLGVAAVKLGQAANLFAERYELVALVPNTSGLREGGSVTVAGQLSGTVESIEFLPVDGDTTENLKVTVKIDERVREQIRSDSRAKLRTHGTAGRQDVRHLARAPFPTRSSIRATRSKSAASLDYEQVLAQAAGAVGDMVAAHRRSASDHRRARAGRRHDGPALTNRTLYDQLAGTLTRTNALLTRLQHPGGTFGRLLDDPALYERIVRLTGSLDTLTRAMASSEGTLGKLMRDDTLYNRLDEHRRECRLRPPAHDARARIRGADAQRSGAVRPAEQDAHGFVGDSRGRSSQSREVHKGDGEGLLGAGR